MLRQHPVSEVRLVFRTSLVRYTGESRYPDVFEIPGFRVALAIASLPGMTIDLCNKLELQDTNYRRALARVGEKTLRWRHYERSPPYHLTESDRG